MRRLFSRLFCLELELCKRFAGWVSFQLKAEREQSQMGKRKGSTHPIYFLFRLVPTRLCSLFIGYFVARSFAWPVTALAIAKLLANSATIVMMFFTSTMEAVDIALLFSGTKSFPLVA